MGLTIVASPQPSPLLDARRRAGLSQRELAAAAGVTRQAVAAVEAGRVQPSVGIALAIARALRTTVEVLFSQGNSESEFDAGWGGEQGARPGARVAVAQIAGTLTARPLDDPSALASLPELAQALVVRSTGAESVRLAHLRTGSAPEHTVFLTGCDVALGLLARHLSDRRPAYRCVWFAGGNAEAIEDLLAGRTHVAAVHLPDQGRRRLFARLRERRGDELVEIELGGLEEGWLVARGNPRSIRGARDLAHPGTRLANRPRGSGARALLDGELRRAGIAPADVQGYATALPGQLDAARAVVQGFADVAVGIASAAHLCGAAFIPLRSERCTLVTTRLLLATPGVSALVETLRSQAYRRDLEALGPYDTTGTGESIAP